MSRTYKTTTIQETLEPHAYVESYSDNKATVHAYKFEQMSEAKESIVQALLDLCVDSTLSNKTKSCTLTAPPSTMYERGEKKVDSMFELLLYARKKLHEFFQTYGTQKLYAKQVFRVTRVHLRRQGAQHIDGSRRKRLKEIDTRYRICLWHRIFLRVAIHLFRTHHFSYVIIDDVSSTGGTLISCRNTLSKHFANAYGKNPHIELHIRIFSLFH